MSSLRVNLWRVRSVAAIACCVGLAVCGAAFAGDGSSRSVSSSTNDDGNNTMTIVDTRDGRTVKIEMRNDKVVNAEINGKSVPADRVVRDGDTIRVKDENGNVVYEHTLAAPVPPVPPTAPTAPRAPRAYTWSFGDGGHAGRARGILTARSSNKSMVGVRLGDVESALRGHFGLKPGEATMVWSVSEGLPADQAGIAPYDIIIGIDGKSPANEDFVRATLKDKDPGAKVEIKVIHRGTEKSITLTTEKWDAEKLEKAKNKTMAMVSGTGFGLGDGSMAWSGGAFEKFGPEMERAYEEAVRGMSWGKFTDDENETPAAEEEDEAPEGGSLPGVSDATPAPSPRAQERMRVMMKRIGGDGDPIVATIVGPDGQAHPQVFVTPKGMNERARELESLARDAARHQEDMRREMEALHKRLIELQQRTLPTPQPVQQEKTVPPGTSQS